MNITIRHQKRNSLAFQLTSSGAVVLVPAHLDPEGEAVQNFITKSLARLPQAEPVTDSLTSGQVSELVSVWSQTIGVAVVRTQIRAMHNKWGSISTAGTLTLADTILDLPRDLAEYIVVHELLHLKFPDHRQGWQVSMGMYLPDWRAREKRLQGFVVADGTEEEATTNG
jgi:hypothetical protein